MHWVAFWGWAATIRPSDTMSQTVPYLVKILQTVDYLKGAASSYARGLTESAHYTDEYTIASIAGSRLWPSPIKVACHLVQTLLSRQSLHSTFQKPLEMTGDRQ